MSYYSYYAPTCAFCGNEQGLVEVNGGRQRTYCSDRCRKAASRKRQRTAKRDAEARRNTELRDVWNEYEIHDQLREMLLAMLFKYGKEVTMDATNAVIQAQIACGKRYRWQR